MKKLSIAIGIVLAALGIFAGTKLPFPITEPQSLSKQEVTAMIDQRVEPILAVVNAPTPNNETMAGATIPVAVARFESSLSNKITSAATSMTLVSGTDSTGRSLSGFLCFTVDEGTATVEDVCGTANGTAITSMTRGIDPLTGTSSVTSLQFEHRRGADVKITDSPQLMIVSRILNGNETIPNRISYDSTIATSSFTTYNVINKQYADGLALQGAPTATTTIPGVVQIGTPTQIGAAVGMTGQYTLVPAGSLFSATTRAATTVPVTLASGKLSQGFLDLTQAFTVTGAWIFNTATTTFNAPVSMTASTTVDTRFAIGTGFTHVQVYTASSTWARPTGVTKVKVRVIGGGGTGGTGSSSGGGGGGGGGYGESIVDVSATSSVQVVVGLTGQTSQFSSFCKATGGSNGGGASPSSGGDAGIGQSCDINIQSDGGGSGSTVSGPLYESGAGGGTPMGGGGKGIGSNTNTGGQSGGTYGGGGSGGTGSSAGGTGAQGVVIVEW